MKRIIATTVVCAGLAVGSPAVATATPDMCAGQVDFKDQSDGVQAGEKSIPACEGDSGPDAFNNAVTPDAVPHPDARPPLAPASTDVGSYGETQNVHDPDGLQADRVLDSPLFTP